MQYSQPPNRSVVVEVEQFDDKNRKPTDRSWGWTNGQIAIDWLKWFIGFVFQFAWGQYTPVTVGLVNIDTVTAYTCQYMQVGTVVSVSGRLNIDVTAAANPAQVSIALPIPSAFTEVSNCAGIAYSKATGETAEITADIVNLVALMDWTATSAAANDWSFHFEYSLVRP